MNRAADKRTERTMKRDKTNVRSIEPVITRRLEETAYTCRLSSILSDRSLCSLLTALVIKICWTNNEERSSRSTARESRGHAAVRSFISCVANPARCAINSVACDSIVFVIVSFVDSTIEDVRNVRSSNKTECKRVAVCRIYYSASHELLVNRGEIHRLYNCLLRGD